MKSTKFWIIAISAVFVLSLVAAIVVWNIETRGVIANIYQNGACVHSVDISGVREPYTLQLEGAVSNTVEVDAGRIRVVSATCPDQICVRQGWISNGVAPIVCLPNNVVIQIENARGAELDTIAG